MRAYAGTVDQRGLRWFLPEEFIPRDLLRHAMKGGLTHATTAVWALLTDEDAEAIRDEPRTENRGGFRSARGQGWLPGLVYARLIGTRLLSISYHLYYRIMT